MPDMTPRGPERHDPAGPMEPDTVDGTDGIAAADETPTPPGNSTPPRAKHSAGRRAAEGGRGDAAEGEAPRRPRKSGNPLLLWLKEIATVVAIAVVLSFLIKTFLFRAFYIPSESMVNTLDINDRIFINLLVPEPFALSRGDVVVFKDNQGWLPATQKEPAGPFKWVQDSLVFVGLLPDGNEQHLVKRVIGLPGDHVTCCDAQGRVSVNGKSLDEVYINPAEKAAPEAFDVVVPAGKIWVMGDNRNHSSDSRRHQETNGGFINLPDVEGKATVIAWPVNRWQVLDNYPGVFAGVPSASPTGK
jgi:signal peptidase I